LKKILHKKRTGGVAQGIGLEFKSQYQKKKKKKNGIQAQPWHRSLIPPLERLK
jgi:hypothetical protein